MWRRVVDELAPEYPGVAVEHMLVDNAAMQLASAPERFDVLVTENMFGDILSDLAAAVTGGLGLAPSASLADDGPGSSSRCTDRRPTSRAAAIANPTAMLRSTALLLEHGLGRPDEAAALGSRDRRGDPLDADARSRRDRGHVGVRRGGKGTTSY